MQQLVNHAIGSLMALCATFAHADAIPSTAQAFPGRAKVEVALQTQGVERSGKLVWSTVARSGGARTAAEPSTSASGTESPVGMLVGALAIMAVMARRRWHNRG